MRIGIEILVLLLDHGAESVAKKRERDENQPERIVTLGLAALLQLVCIRHQNGENQKHQRNALHKIDFFIPDRNAEKQRNHDREGSEHARQRHWTKAKRLVSRVHREAEASAVAKTKKHRRQMESEVDDGHQRKENERGGGFQRVKNGGAFALLAVELRHGGLRSRASND